MVPDYYAILEVDPQADRATIEAALRRKQPAWSSGTRNPKTKHSYQSYLDQIPAIRQALLGDPAARTAYDAEREATERADRDRRLDALQKRVRLRAAKGGLTVSDRALLRDEARKLGLAAADADRLAEPFPPLPEAPNEPEETEGPADVLDPVMRRQLRTALDHLGKLDLYDALGLPRDAPAREIAARADAERQRWMRKTQVTAEKTAWLEVVTLAQSHLTAPSPRARYDRTLVIEAEDSLVESIRFSLQGLSRLDPGTRAMLLDEAAATGITPDRAERLIQRTCRTLGVARDGPGLGPAIAPANGAARLFRCRSCSGITPFSPLMKTTATAVCRHCRAPLRWNCPSCKRPHWVDEPRCSCGFRLSWFEPFVRHFEAAQQAFRNRDYGAALAHLRRAQEYAPDHVGSRKGVEKVRERINEIERLRTSGEVALSGHRLLAARAAIEDWGRLVPPESVDWQSAAAEVARQLREASLLAAKARTKEHTDPAAARELYRRSLALAVDLPEALTGLHRCPPDPPSELTAEFVDDRVRLRWSPPPPDGLGPVSFVVLRKAESALKHPADGVRIGQVDRPEFEDDGVVAGTSVAYAVLSRRGDVESIGAVAVGPIFLMGEVRHVQIETRAREVDLGWTPPPGASEVRVVRKGGGPPTGPLDGERVEALLDQAHDRGLETDRTYHYGLFAIYRAPDGRATASRGVLVSAQPQPPTPIVEAPRIVVEPDGGLRIQWIEPSRGIVKLLRSPRPLPYPPGSRLTPAQVAALAGEWVPVIDRDHARDAPPASGFGHYTPLCSWGGYLTVGRPAVFTTLADPSDLRATRLGDGRVVLRWRWGPNGTRTLVVARAGAPPAGPDDPDAVVETIHQADDARQGQHVISLPDREAGPWHVTLYSQATLEGESVTSPGLEPSARTVVPGRNLDVSLSYRFLRNGFWRRGWLVAIATEPPDAPTPPLVLVIHPRALPHSAEDGHVAAEFPASVGGGRFPLPAGLNLSRVCARIFPDPRLDPDDGPPLRLVHPGDDPARV